MYNNFILTTYFYLILSKTRKQIIYFIVLFGDDEM